MNLEDEKRHDDRKYTVRERLHAMLWQADSAQHVGHGFCIMPVWSSFARVRAWSACFEASWIDSSSGATWTTSLRGAAWEGDRRLEDVGRARRAV